LGLAIGIASFLLITFFIIDELSYDRYHSKANRIFRLHQVFESEGLGEKAASLPFPVLDPLLNDYPEQIESSCRFFNFQAPSLALATIDNSKQFNESRVFFTDSTLFEVFDFPLISGDKKSALRQPNTMLITESMARKYFGEENAIGKYLKLQQQEDVLITGILKDTPDNSHFKFDFLISFSTVKNFYASGHYPANWSWNPVWTYLLLKDRSEAERLQMKMPEFVTKYYPESYHSSVTLFLFPLTGIHLHSKLDYEVGPNNNITTIYILGGIAVFVLLIACINFINLSTARASKRSKEVGMRKTLGSQRSELITQFLSESILLSVIAFLFAIVMVAVALPFFNTLADKHISFQSIEYPAMLAMLCLFPVLLGIIAGAYPAFVLSAFKPVSALKATTGEYAKGSLHKTLVIVQFTLSIVLLISTGVTFDQLNLLQHGDTGFSKENVVIVPVMRSGVTNSIYETMKTEFLRNEHVLAVTAVEDIVGSKHQVYSYKFEGLSEVKPFPALQVRHDFAKTFDVPMVAGRDYSEDYVRDDSLGLVVNEELVRSMGWKSNEEAIGKKFEEKSDRKIIGVIKDFNFTSRHIPIRPLVLDLVMHPASFKVFIKYMAIRIDSDHAQATTTHLQQQWKALLPEWPFEYFYLGQNLDELYKAERKLSSITTIFATLSILVGCLGLFGLSTFTAEQRRKEMSIRKVLGGSDAQIFVLFSGNFLRLIIISAVLAFPLAYFALRQWLSVFAYQADIDLVWFFIAALVTVGITLLTVSYQALSIARSNPATVLKNE
jgi:putative ABC transport system permease protein